MAVAAAQRGENRRAVAIIGDGALTAGMAFEALNHAGSLPTDLLIVLNDNDMSISENVGALSNYLARALSGRMYSHLRESGKKVLSQMPTVWELARRSEEHLKGMVLPGTLFEEMGFNYIGPIDGHDVKALVSTLRNLQKLRGPQFLHVVTRKGKGYAPAEADPIKWHGPGPVRSGQRHDLQGGEQRAHLLADLRQVAVRHGRTRSRHRRHHAGDARRLGTRRISRSDFPSATTMSRSPNSTRSLSPRASRPKGSSPWSRSIRPSCSAPTISSFTTSPCRICRWYSPWTGPASSAATAPPIKAATI